MMKCKEMITLILLTAVFLPATVFASEAGGPAEGNNGKGGGGKDKGKGNGGNKMEKNLEMTPAPIEKVTSQFPGYVHVDEAHCWEQRMKTVVESLKGGIAACNEDPNCGAVYNVGCGERSDEIYLCPVGFTALPGKDSCIFEKATTEETSRTETGYAKLENKHCYNQSFDKGEFKYQSVDDAKKVCDEDPLCGGVYDNDCASVADEIFLCRSGFTGQSSSKSCVYEKEDTKVVVDPNATDAPVAQGQRPAFDYHKEHNVHCFSTKMDDHIYSTRNEAMIACDDLETCLGIYDQNCDETPVDIYLCSVGSKFEGSSTGSCVFGKGVRNGEVLTDPNGDTDPKDEAEVADGYKKREQTHCFENKYGIYSSMNEAKAACNADDNCKAVYDQGCDESANDIFLCAKGYSAEASSTSCTWRKEIKEDETEAPTPAPTIETSFDVQDYQKIENVHCRNTKLADKFDSVQTALAACDANAKCIGVYDNHCNESPEDVYLCAMGGKYDASGTGSCVYNKSVFEYEYLKLDQKHCYNHKHAESFDTIASAKAACDKEPNCMGIYDQNCDESSEDIFLCESGHQLEPSSESCVLQRGQKDVSHGEAVWITEPSVHCFSTKYPETGYKTRHEAKKACMKDSNCYGVYDQECDQENGDIFLCPVGVAPTKSHSGSCIVRKDTNAGYTAAPTTPVETAAPSTVDEAEDEGDYDYSYKKQDLLHCFNNRVSETGAMVSKDASMMTFDTLSEAKKACDNQKDCTAVYDQNCDESAQDIFLCHSEGVPTTSGASCIYERSTKKVDVNASTWKTHVNRHCFDNAMKDGYETLAAAKKACDHDSLCYGIYDRQCDMTKGQIFLCPVGAQMKESITGSCVIEKLSPDDTWQQLPKTHCAEDKYKKFHTVDEAKEACMADPMCSFVYDNNCDQSKGDIFLCPLGTEVKESSTSCTYAKPRGSRTPFPTLNPTHYHSVNKYDKEMHFHCFQRKYGLFDSIVEAQKACDIDEDCEAVYDQSCDNSARDIFLCPKGYLKEKSATSCVWTKKGDTVITRAPTPAPVGLKKCNGLDKKTCNLKENKAECEWVFMSFCQNNNNPWRPETCSQLPTEKSCPKVVTDEAKKCSWDAISNACAAPTKGSVKHGTKCKKAAKNEQQCVALKGCKWQRKKNGVTKCKGKVKKQ